MKPPIRLLSFLLIIGTVITGCGPKARKSSINPENFKQPTAQSGVHMWWHWMDGNITKEGIRKDLEAMAQQGITQVTILNVGMYRQQFQGLKNVQFNSPEWYDMFRYALEKADSLNIKVGAQNCDGWSTSGGPWISPENAMKEICWSKAQVKGGNVVEKSLSQPYALNGFYRDVAVVAIKSYSKISNFIKAEPQILNNNIETHNLLYDGCPVGGTQITPDNELLVRFENAFETNRICIHPRRKFMWGITEKIDTTSTFYTLEAKNNFGVYKHVSDFKIKGFNKTVCVPIPKTKSNSFRLRVNGLKKDEELFIGELELLKKDEQPFYNTKISHLQAKTESVQNATENQYYNILAEDVQADYIQPDEIIDLTDRMDEHGNLKWEAPEGIWEVIRFGYTITGSTNFPATEKGFGLECDKMDTIALNLHFKSYPQKLIDCAGEFTGNTFKFLLVDSWECKFQNWTESFPHAFEQQNGYSIKDWIPVLCGAIVENSKMTESFLYDYRKTIASLIERNYFGHLAELCHRSDLELHGEVIYGGPKLPPLDVLKAYSHTDVPMFEFWARENKDMEFMYEAKPTPISHFAASAALFYNKDYVGAEAYTGHASYSESPWKLKAFGDRAFCSGINQMILHSYIHQPTNVKPGIAMRWFFGQPFNRLNSYWEQLSGWTMFQSRIQSVLQNSKEVNDILFYIGDRLPQFSIKLDSVPKGYHSNVCNFDVLTNKLAVKNNKIRFDNEVAFSLLVLPAQKGMNYKTLLRLEEMIKEGAYVYGTKPEYLYSLSDEKNHLQDFNRIVNLIWGERCQSERNIVELGKGKVLWGMTIKEALNEIELQKDFSATPSGDSDFLFLHKKSGDMDVYFVANQYDHSTVVQCKFRIENKIPQVWDPLTGEISSVEYVSNSNSTLIPFKFAPFESVFFVFQDKVENNTTEGIQKIREYELSEMSGTIDFNPAYNANVESVKIDSLISLTEFSQPEIKYFGGKAIYQLEFTMPDSINSMAEYDLNLGHFNATAVISLNGKMIGEVWSPQQNLKIGEVLQQGKNKLQVIVAIPYRNRIMGDLIQYGELKTMWTSCEISNHMKASLPLISTGLLGPVKISCTTK